jgi:DNA-binding MarR family transcriptional regulator
MPGKPARRSTTGPTAQEAIVSLFRAAARLRRAFSAAVEPRGVTLQQFNVLRILRGAGGAGLTVTAIGDRMIDREPGVTRLIDRLERRGLVARTRTSPDRRHVVVTITPDGLAVVRSLDRPIEQLDQSVAGGLTPGERQLLITLLERLGA